MSCPFKLSFILPVSNPKIHTCRASTAGKEREEGDGAQSSTAPVAAQACRLTAAPPMCPIFGFRDCQTTNNHAPAAPLHDVSTGDRKPGRVSSAASKFTAEGREEGEVSLLVAIFSSPQPEKTVCPKPWHPGHPVL